MHRFDKQLEISRTILKSDTRDGLEWWLHTLAQELGLGNGARLLSNVFLDHTQRFK